MGRPAAGAGNGENRGEQIGRNAKAVVHRRAVEIDVRVQVLLGEHDLGDPLRHLNPLRVTQLGGQNLSHALEVRGARVEHFVHAVTDAHDLALLSQAVGHIGIDLIERTNLLEHFDDPLVGAAMKRALEGADGCGDRRVHVAERGDSNPSAEGGGVHAMVGMQHVAHINGALLFNGGLLAIDHPEEVGSFAQSGIGCDQRQSLAGTVEVGRNDRDLGDEAQGLAALGIHVVVVGGGVVAAQSTHAGADGVHRGAVLRQASEHVDHALGQFAIARQNGLEAGQLLRVGQVVVIQQMHHFFVAHLPCQLVDVVAAVDQLPYVTAHVAEPSVGGDNAFKALGNGRGSGRRGAHVVLGRKERVLNYPQVCRAEETGVNELPASF